MQKKKIKRIVPQESVRESIVYHALTAGRPKALRIANALSKYDIKDSSGDEVLLHLLRSGALTFTDVVDILPPAVFMEKNSGEIPLLGRMLELSLVTEPEKLFLSSMNGVPFDLSMNGVPFDLSMNDVLFDLNREDADGRSLASRFQIGDGTRGAEMFREIASESKKLLVKKMESSHREKCSEPSEAERIARTFRAACETFDAESSWGIVGAACLQGVSSVADKTGESPSTEAIEAILDDAYRNLDAGMKEISSVPKRAEAVLDARRAGSEALVALSSMPLNKIASGIVGEVILESLKHVDVRDMVGDSAALHLVASGKIHSSALCLDNELFDVLMSKNNKNNKEDTLLHRLLEMNLIDKETTMFIAERAPYDSDETIASMMSMNKKHMSLEAALRALEGKKITKEGVFDGRR